MSYTPSASLSRNWGWFFSREFDGEKIIELGQEGYGAPADALVSEEKFAKIRQQAQMQQQAEQALMAGREVAEIGKSAAQAESLLPKGEGEGA